MLAPASLPKLEIRPTHISRQESHKTYGNRNKRQQLQQSHLIQSYASIFP
jgi:hypothetical protein